MNNCPYTNEGFYHIYNRGVEKRSIFMNRYDYLRFLEAIDYYRKFPQSKKLSDYRRGTTKWNKAKNQKQNVKMFCYCLMPNHYHLLIKQLTDNGITEFMRKLSDSYTRFFNTKYDRVGPLFQGKFKAKYIENDEYLLQLSRYIHRNPFPLRMWEGKIYPYSSYWNYISGKKHNFCDTNFILDYFTKSNPELDYKNFVEDTDYFDPSLFDSLIDAKE